MAGTTSKADGDQSDLPVLIVGGGPVGLAMAIFLARLGHRSVVIEKTLPRESSAPKAHVLNPRSLEILRSFGVDTDALRNLSAHAAEGNCARFLDVLTGTEFGSLPLEPTYEDARLSPSPTPLLNLAQPVFESVLLEHAKALSAIEIRRGHTFAGCDSGARSVTVHIETDTGSYSQEGAYLVAADGANSAVREVLGIALDGTPAIRPRVTIHFEADLRHLVEGRPAVLYWILDPKAHGTLISYDPAGTWVYTPRVGQEAFDKADYTPVRCRQLICKALGREGADIAIKHVVPWMMSAQVAERYASGRSFLVGDAAHRFPPTGGFGLNTGIQDAHNLAWKLAALLEHRADAGLLLTYETERQPVARINTAQSVQNAQRLNGLFASAAEALSSGKADAASSNALSEEIKTHLEHFLSEGMQLGFTYGPPVRGAPDPLRYVPSLDLGARLPHAWFNYADQRRSTHDLVELRRFTLLVGEQAAEEWRLAIGDLPDCKVEVLPAEARFESPWIGTSLLRDGGAILVRPDAHIANVLNNLDSQALIALQASLESFGFKCWSHSG